MESIESAIKAYVSKTPIVEDAYDVLVSEVNVLKDIVRHGMVKALTGILEELFEIYGVVPINIDFETLSKSVIEKKIGIGKILAKIKETHEKGLNSDKARDKRQGKRQDVTSTEDVARVIINVEEPSSNEPGTVPKKRQKRRKEKETSDKDNIVNELLGSGINVDSDALSINETVPDPVPVTPSQVIEPIPDPAVPITTTAININATISDNIVPGIRELIISMGTKVRDVMLPNDSDFRVFWEEVTSYVNSETGKNVINEYRGKKDYFVASVGFISYKRAFENKEQDRSMAQFYGEFGYDKKNCHRSLMQIRESGFTF